MTYLKNISSISILKNSSPCIMQDDQAFFADRTKSCSFGNSTKSHFLKGFISISTAITADADTTIPISAYGLKPSITANARIGGSATNANLSTGQSVCALYSAVDRASSVKALINDTGDIVQANSFVLIHLVCKG